MSLPLDRLRVGQIRAEPAAPALRGAGSGVPTYSCMKLYVRGGAGVPLLGKQPQKPPWASQSCLCPCSFLHPLLCLLGVRSAQHLLPEHLLCVGPGRRGSSSEKWELPHTAAGKVAGQAQTGIKSGSVSESSSALVSSLPWANQFPLVTWASP